MVRQRLGLDLPSDAARALAPDGGDPGMVVVDGPVDELRLGVDLALEDLIDRQAAQPLAVRGAQLDDVARRSLEIGGEGDRYRPDPAVRELHPLAHGRPVLGAHEAAKRSEAAVCEQLEVGGLAG